MDLGDKNYQNCVSKLSIQGVTHTDKYYYNGWSQMISIKQLYNTFKSKISPHFLQLVNEILNRNDLNKMDINVNVRGDVKKFLMYPNYSYEPFQPYEDNNLLTLIKKELDYKPHVLKIVDGKLYCMLPQISDTLSAMINNDESRHLTIINSNELTDSHYTYEYIVIDDIEYYGLAFTPVRDYPLFKEVIVAKCNSNKLNNIIAKELGTTKSLHFTVKRTLRDQSLFFIPF